MERNGYEGLMEGWKLAMIRAEIASMRFPAHERDDAMQEAVLAVLDFTYQPEKANGTSEEATFHAVIRQRLSHFRRKALRATGRERRYLQIVGNVEEQCVPDTTEAVALSEDVSAVLRKLSPKQRAAVEAVARGGTLDEIAEKLGTSRYHIQMALFVARQHFEAHGMA